MSSATTCVGLLSVELAATPTAKGATNSCELAVGKRLGGTRGGRYLWAKCKVSDASDSTWIICSRRKQPVHRIAQRLQVERRVAWPVRCRFRRWRAACLVVAAEFLPDRSGPLASVVGILLGIVGFPAMNFLAEDPANC